MCLTSIQAGNTIFAIQQEILTRLSRDLRETLDQVRASNAAVGTTREQPLVLGNVTADQFESFLEYVVGMPEECVLIGCTVE